MRNLPTLLAYGIVGIMIAAVVAAGVLSAAFLNMCAWNYLVVPAFHPSFLPHMSFIQGLAVEALIVALASIFKSSKA